VHLFLEIVVGAVPTCLVVAIGSSTSSAGSVCIACLPFSQSAFDIACIAGHRGVAKFLLQHGANPHHVTPSVGSTALYMMWQSDEMAEVSFLFLYPSVVQHLMASQIMWELASSVFLELKKLFPVKPSL
jgi:ankyrin repeat protein